jgi:hypothetical protein
MKPEELKALAELLGLKQAESVSAAMLAKGATWIAPGNDYVRLDWLTDPRGMLWIRRQLAAQNCLFHASLQPSKQVRVAFYAKSGRLFVGEGFDKEEVEANAIGALAALKQLAAEKGAVSK